MNSQQLKLASDILKAQYPQPLIGQILRPYPAPDIFPRRKLNPFFIKIGGPSPTNCRTAGATLQREFNKSFQPS